MLLVRTCPQCGAPAYPDAEDEEYTCSNPRCLYVWEMRLRRPRPKPKPEPVNDPD